MLACMLSAKCWAHSKSWQRVVMQDLVDRCLSSNPVMRPSMPDISDALLSLRDTLAGNPVQPPPHQSPPQQTPLSQQTSPQQIPRSQQTSLQHSSPFAQPSNPTRVSLENRQSVTRQRINATQYQLPVRRQWVVTRDGLVRQGSTPQPPPAKVTGFPPSGAAPPS